jgi:hypothetical protein
MQIISFLEFVFQGEDVQVFSFKAVLQLSYFIFLKKLAGYWWLTPTILAIQGGRDQEDRGSKPALGR